MTEPWRHPRVRRWAFRGGIAFACYLLGGFLLVPWIVKSQILRHLPTATHREARLREVRFNPFTLALTLRGLALVETNGTPFASFEEFHANFQLSSLFRLSWTFDTLRLDSPRLEVAIGADGRLNLADLLASPEPAPPAPPEAKAPAGIPSLTVFRLVITNGAVGFSDASRRNPFRTSYEPIHLNLTHFTTQPDRSSPYSFEASSDSGRGIRWAGTVTAQPPGSAGTLEISGIQLPKHAPYLDDVTRAQIADGELDISGAYRFALGTNGTDLVVSNLAVTLSRLRVEDPDSREAVFELPSAAIRDAGFDLRARRARVGSVRVSEPSALVRRRADGTLNLVALAPPAPTSPPTHQPASKTPPAETGSPPWVVEVASTELIQGTVRFEDLAVSEPFRTTLHPVTLQARDVSTATGTQATLDFGLTTEASESLRSSVRFGVSPIRASGSIDVAGVALPKYGAYVAPYFRGRIRGGTTEVHAEFSAALEGDAPQLSVTNGRVRVADLAVADPVADRTPIEVPEFLLSGATLQLEKKEATVASLAIRGTRLALRREPDGSLDWSALLPTPPQPAAVNEGAPKNSPGTPLATPTPEPAWTFRLQEFGFREGRVRVDDLALPRPGRLELGPIDLSARGTQFPSNAPVAVEFAAALPGSGKIGLRGTVAPYSPAAEAELTVEDVRLAPAEPWLSPHLNLGLPEGAVRSRLQIVYGKPGETNRAGIQVRGHLGITNLVAIETVSTNELLRWKDWSVDGIDVDLEPRRVALGRIRWVEPKASILLDAQGRPNLLAVLRSGGATNSASAGPAPTPATTTNAPPSATPNSAGSFPIRIAEVGIEGASLHFADRSIAPPCTFDLRRLDATITGLSSEVGDRATASLSGIVDEGAPFGLRGSINPLSATPFLDVAFTNHHLQLTAFSPYMEKYAGYPLNKGRLSLDLKYGLREGALDATNKVRLEQLMLGSRNDSPDATQLPVKLAIALLKDGEGVIDLDVPLQGRLDDPKFRIGPIVGQVIGNLIAKVATSPFKLIGALVGGGDELSFVAFDPGTFDLPAGETNKLAKLVEALGKRPALNLEIEGSADPVLDRDALARAEVRRRIQAERLRETAAVGNSAAHPINAPLPVLDPIDASRLLRAALVRSGITNVAESLQALARRNASNAVVASRSPAPGASSPSWYRRLTSVFKPGAERDAVRQAHRAAKEDEALRKQNPELAALGVDDMESLLASRTDVPADALLQLGQDRAKAVQAWLSGPGGIAPDRLFLATPRRDGARTNGTSRVQLSLQ